MKFLIVISLTLFVGGASAQQADKALSKEAAKNTIAEKSQTKVTATADKTREIVDEYRAALRKIENAKVYNHQMRELIKSQEEETVNIRKTIVELKQTNKEIIPFSLRLLDNLRNFVKMDVPFHKEKRELKLENLTVLMGKGNVSTAEKFRKILEDYQRQNDYGKSMESYKGVYKNGDQEMTVDYLRVGRVFLGLQSIDGSYSAYWDKASKSWKELPGEYEDSVAKGIKMARKMIAPDLIKLPIEKAVAATASTTEVK